MPRTSTSAISLSGVPARDPLAWLHRWSLRGAVLLALGVIVLGATVRLSDAGLSCPDWPGCYGQLSVAAAAANSDVIERHWPHRPLDPARARLEMTHRYAAGGLVALILAIGLIAWRRGRGRRAAAALLALVALQALLGMWTVTLGLRPLVVVGHLLGGLGLLGLLWWLVLEEHREDPGERSADHAWPAARGRSAPRVLSVAALGLLLMQIALGGWTSSNQAALACGGFPTCNGAWWPDADFADGFRLTRPDSGAAAVPSGPALVAIHWTHRLGALAVTLVLGALIMASRGGAPPVRWAAGAVGVLVAAQIGLGIANVLVGRPLPLAVGHNAVAALLLLSMLALMHRLWRGSLAVEGSA